MTRRDSNLQSQQASDRPPGEQIKVDDNFLVEPPVKRPLGRPKCDWENDIKVELNEVWW
jgi:hypothetical protein